MNGQVQVSGRSAIRTRLSVAREFDFLSVFYTRRNRNAYIFTIYRKGLFVCMVGVREFETHLSGNVSAAKTGLSSAGLLCAEESLEEIRMISTPKIAPVAICFLSGCLASSALRLTGLFKLFGMLPVFTVLIIFLPAFGIAQYLLCLIDLLKFLLSLFIIRVQIGMVFTGQFAVCFFNILCAGLFGQAQDFVVVNKLHMSKY
ncbi:hypothetical protein D9M68_676500 [compost metagenome]